ncbi:unnamed protein product [Trichobilharzia regenti]|nr:unnamed protein product [Trichobilharzia regenti]
MASKYPTELENRLSTEKNKTIFLGRYTFTYSWTSKYLLLNVIFFNDSMIGQS